LLRRWPRFAAGEHQSIGLLAAPNKKVKAVRPSTSRKKAPFEAMGRRSKILQAKSAKKGS
jgi:hypothetical protein